MSSSSRASHSVIAGACPSAAQQTSRTQNVEQLFKSTLSKKGVGRLLLDLLWPFPNLIFCVCFTNKIFSCECKIIEKFGS